MTIIRHQMERTRILTNTATKDGRMHVKLLGTKSTRAYFVNAKRALSCEGDMGVPTGRTKWKMLILQGQTIEGISGGCIKRQVGRYKALEKEQKKRGLGFWG